MRALVSDSEAFSQLCEKSLTWRGKDSLSRTWLQRWKRENWMQHLCSRTLKPSHTDSFVDTWTSFPEDSRVSHSQLLESVKLLKTPDTSSPTSQTELESANLELFSSKTYKGSSPAKQQTESQFSNMSSKSWKEWVTEQRQEYSQRKKSAHLIRESESTSLGWQTPTTMDIERTPEGMEKRKAYRESIGRKYVEGCLTEQVKNWSTPTVMDTANIQKPRKKNPSGGQKPPLCQEVKNWPTPTAVNRVRDEETMEKCLKFRQSNGQTSVPLYLEEKVIREPQNWPTATARDWKGCGNAITRKDGKHRIDNLEAMIKYGHPDQANPNTNGKSQESWPTPRANKVHPEITEQNREHLANRKKSNLEEDIAGHCGKATGKLNPNWVEHLMGLPAGWTDLGSWETE